MTLIVQCSPHDLDTNTLTGVQTEAESVETTPTPTLDTKHSDAAGPGTSRPAGPDSGQGQVRACHQQSDNTNRCSQTEHIHQY